MRRLTVLNLPPQLVFPGVTTITPTCIEGGELTLARVLKNFGKILRSLSSLIFSFFLTPYADSYY
jgi:hypothetical protein